MPSKLAIDQVDVALVALGRVSMPTLYGEALDVDSIGPNDFNSDGQLILRSPCVRLRFNNAEFSAGKDNQRLTYNAGLAWTIMCFAENLRSDSDQRQDTLKLLNAALECFAGARLQLVGSGPADPIEVTGVVPMMNEGEIIDGFYAVQIRVPGIAQFSGVNARFGER